MTTAGYSEPWLVDCRGVRWHKCVEFAKAVRNGALVETDGQFAQVGLTSSM